MTKTPEQRIRRHLSPLRDLTLIVLKGHLLIEEHLDHFLSVAVQAPEHLRDARLTYSQKVHLVHAISSVGADLFTFATALNKIRNGLAHSLDVVDLPGRVDSLLRQNIPGLPRGPSRQQLGTWLRHQIVVTCGRLYGSAEVFQATTQANRALQRSPRSRRPLQRATVRPTEPAESS
jgi:hypothetical protein